MQTTLHAQPKSASPLSMTPVCGGVLQRKCACGGSAGVMSECDDCSNKKLSLHRSTENVEGATQSSKPETRNSKLEKRNSLGVPPIVHGILRSPGQPLDATDPRLTGLGFGHNFRQISIYYPGTVGPQQSTVNDRSDLFKPASDWVTPEHLAPMNTVRPRIVPARQAVVAKGESDDQMGASEELELLGESEDPPEGQEIPTSVVENLSPAPTKENKLKAKDWGLTLPEKVTETVSAVKSGTKWQVDVTALEGEYSKQARLLPSVQEVTGPDGNTTSENFCDQLDDLIKFGNDRHVAWFMLDAVIAHENVHATRILPAFKIAAADIQKDFSRVTVPDATDKSAESALMELKAKGGYLKAQNRMRKRWMNEFAALAEYDHDRNGPTEMAERTVLDPMMAAICNRSREKQWGACKHCRE